MTDQPLLMAKCCACDTRFFFARPPRASAQSIASIRTTSDEPAFAGQLDILPHTCPACSRPILIQIQYEP